MNYTVEDHEKYTIFTVHEKNISADVAPDLKSELVAQHSKGVTCIVLDLSEVKYVDSSGLSALLVGNRIFQREEEKFILAGLSEHVTKLIDISQLSTILAIFPTLDEALKNVSKSTT